MNISGNVRYQSTNERIEKAALNLLKRRGYDNFSVKDLCIEASINRSSFYAHYQDINDLMIKIEQGLTKKQQDIWQNIASEKSDMFVEFFSLVKEHKEFYKSFLKSHNQSFAANEILKKHKEVFKKYSMSRGFNYTDAELDYHLHYFGGGLKAVSGRWIQNDCKETPEQMAKIIEDEYTKNARFATEK